ncbi:MAG: hypothetical protein EOO16_05580 [Chitinophagaceae bacterium]|nr:MAG: hypothetical protein EOO16_05580 [Chitinophagaceae bacterium]
MKKLYLLLLLIVSIPALAQKGAVRGFLLDGTASQRRALDDATISVMNGKDSTLVAFGLTSATGYFEIKSLAPGSYYVMVSYTGFSNLTKGFSVSDAEPVADLGDLKMNTNFKTLDEVVIKDVAPIRIKGDTVEYNAGAFKTKPNANVEDLLKKLPGVQVEKDGTVKAQGENVQKVYVDGKEFFGSDPKLATKNLSADMVESVQVYDDMSDQAKFSKIDDGSRAKAINIKIKKDKKHGYFAKATAGYGTDDRYDASLSFNRFKGNTQVSVIGAANNVNKQGFSFSDMIGAMGGMGGMMRGGDGGGGGTMGGGNMTMGSRTGGGSGMSLPGMGSSSQGIARSLSAGGNYRDVWGPKIDVNGSLFHSNTRNIATEMRNRQTFFPQKDAAGIAYDSSAFWNTRSRSVTENANTRFNFRLEWRLDSMNSLLYTPSVTLQHSEDNATDSSTTTSLRSGKTEELAFQQQNRNTSGRDGQNINQNLLWRHRFRRAGRTLTAGLTSAINNSDGDGSFYSPITSYVDGPPQTRIVDQQSMQRTRAFNNTLSASYTEPLGRNKILEANYAYTRNYSESERRMSDFNPLSGKYDIISQLQTNSFENTFVAHRVGANFRLQQRKYNFQVGIGVQFSEMNTHSFRAYQSKDTNILLKYTNLFPTANFQYSFTRNKNLRFNYRGRTNQPGITQLQDARVPNNNNQLYQSTGNPRLGQEFVNTFSLGYNSFQFMTFRYFGINLNVTQTSDKIVNSIEQEGRVQVSRPVNVNGAYNAMLFVGFGTPVKKFKGLNVNVNWVNLVNRDVSMVDQNDAVNVVDLVRSFNRTLMSSATFGFNYNYKEKLDLGISATGAYNDINYGSGATPSQRYWNQTYSADITWTLKKNFILATDFDYFVNSGRADGFNQSIPMWNASIGKQFLKAKQAEIRLSVNDILNQNQSITRNTGINYVEDVQTNVLRRFFMLSFTYNLNKMGGKNMFSMPRQMERGVRNLRIN